MNNATNASQTPPLDSVPLHPIVRLSAGQVWRKHGPCDWLRVNRIMLPNTEHDDGGLPGVSFDALARGGKRKKPMGWFVPGMTEAAIIRWLANSGRSVESNAKALPLAGREK